MLAERAGKRIVTYNVNGIRAALRKGLARWLEDLQPDIICLQEIKALESQCEPALFKHLGYNSYWYSAQKKGYSGVAILSREKPDNVIFGCGETQFDNEGRIIRADFGELSVMSVYFPSGSSGEHRQAVKFDFLDFFQPYIMELKKDRPKLVISGDYNICHKPIDIHDPVRLKNTSGFLPEERQWMDVFFGDNNMVDAFRQIDSREEQYTWWSYFRNARARNKGWRIDYHGVSDNLAPSIKDCVIMNHVHHSDHCPVLLKLNIAG